MWCRGDARLWHACHSDYFISPLCGVVETPDYGMLVIHLLYKALYVASLRRLTVACLLFYYLYKPFMRCRTDARLWHVCYLLLL